MIHPLDAAMQAVTPVIAAPKYGSLEPLAGSGQRYILGENELYLEFRRPWIHGCVPVTPVPGRTPYGPVHPGVKLLCGNPPRQLFDQFARAAASQAPDEHAAWITWSERTREFHYREVEVLERNSMAVRYRWPELAEGEWKVIDMHSHGAMPASFSEEDDADDHGAVKIALVLGNCDTEQMSQVRRLSVLGLFLGTQWIGKEVRHADASAA